MVRALLARYMFLDSWQNRLAVGARIPCLRPIAGLLDEYLPSQGTVVDLGCGYGLSLHLVRQLRDVTVWGIELDPHRYHIGKTSVAGDSQVNIMQGELLSRTWPHASAILLLDVLFLIPSEGKRQIIQRCSETLTPGGVLIVKDTAFVPRWKYLYTQFEERCKLGLNAYGGSAEHNLHYFRPDVLHRLAQSSRFEHIKTKLISAIAPYPGITYVYRRV